MMMIIIISIIIIISSNSPTELLRNDSGDPESLWRLPDRPSGKNVEGYRLFSFT